MRITQRAYVGSSFNLKELLFAFKTTFNYLYPSYNPQKTEKDLFCVDSGRTLLWC